MKAPCLSNLPHRPPFLLVDRIVDSEPGCWIRAEKLVSLNEPRVSPDGTLSAMFLIEGIAQTCALLYCQELTAPLLLGIDRARFPLLATAGDCIRLYAEILWLRQSKGLGKARGTAHRQDGVLLCELELTFAFPAK